MGAIEWLGDSGTPPTNRTLSKVGKRINNKAAFDSFTSNMDAHTKCVWATRIYMTKEFFGASPPATGANIDVKAILYYRDPDTLEVLHFDFPAPIDADVEDIG
jgi:hypothetical protein